MINTREVISFIDNFIVEIEEEKKIKGVLDQLTPKKVKNIQKFLRLVSGIVHTRVEVHRMDSEMSGLVERPWFQLICCTVCLLHGHNFR